ncbi:MAG: hypothetical protein WAV95_17185 [Azonexus sp.]
MLQTPPRHWRWTYPIIFACVLLVLFLAVTSEIISPRDLAIPLLSVIGTFLGASYAFRLNEDKEHRKLDAARREALNRALFVMARQINAIHQLTSDLTTYQSEFERAFNFPALKPPSYQDLTHNIADLEFLLDTPTPDLLMRICIEQERFFQAIASLNYRNDFYVDVVQPALSEYKLNGKLLLPADLQAVLGDRIFGGAIAGANVLWAHMTGTHESIPVVFKALFDLAKQEFPGHKFVTFDAG